MTVHALGDRVYWRSMYGHLVGGFIEEKRRHPERLAIQYLVRPDGGVTVYGQYQRFFAMWMDGPFLSLPALDVADDGDLNGTPDQPRES